MSANGGMISSGYPVATTSDLSNYALSSHTHSEYAPSSHTHSNYVIWFISNITGRETF